MDEAEEDMEMAQDPFLEAGISIPHEMPHHKTPSPHRNHALLEYCFCLDFTAIVVFIGVVFLCPILVTRSLLQPVISNYLLFQTHNVSSKAPHELLQ